MTDKSEIEAIRAVKRYNPCDIKARNGFDLDSELVLAADYDRLLSHVDALEARVAQLEGALRETADEFVEYLEDNEQSFWADKIRMRVTNLMGKK